MTRRKGLRGFTFVETLAAIVFIAIVTPALVQALTLSARLASLSERQRVAAVLADAKLGELALTDEWRRGETEGDFAEDAPGYSWTLESEAWSEAGMRLLTIQVNFQSGGRDHALALSTLVEDAE
jgi:type II secretory pathway pseudopilin PulG